MRQNWSFTLNAVARLVRPRARSRQFLAGSMATRFSSHLPAAGSFVDAFRQTARPDARACARGAIRRRRSAIAFRRRTRRTGAYSALPLLVVSHHRRVPRIAAWPRVSARSTSRPTSRRSGPCSRKAPATSTTGSSAARISTPTQRAVEPRNADSHLAFMASGLRTCVTHPNRPGRAGVLRRPRRRQRRTAAPPARTRSSASSDERAGRARPGSKCRCRPTRSTRST